MTKKKQEKKKKKYAIWVSRETKIALTKMKEFHEPFEELIKKLIEKELIKDESK